MTIFIRLFKFCKSVGLIIVLVVTSYVLTSIVYYSRKHPIESYNKIELIEDSYIEVIDQRVTEYITLDVSTKKEIRDEYLIAYALYYKDITNKDIHLYVVDKEKVVNVGKTEIYIIKK